jgi:hypothetical protein
MPIHTSLVISALFLHNHSLPSWPQAKPVKLRGRAPSKIGRNSFVGNILTLTFLPGIFYEEKSHKLVIPEIRVQGGGGRGDARQERRAADNL